MTLLMMLQRAGKHGLQPQFVVRQSPSSLLQPCAPLTYFSPVSGVVEAVPQLVKEAGAGQTPPHVAARPNMPRGPMQLLVQRRQAFLLSQPALPASRQPSCACRVRVAHGRRPVHPWRATGTCSECWAAWGGPHTAPTCTPHRSQPLTTAQPPPACHHSATAAAAASRRSPHSPPPGPSSACVQADYDAGSGTCVKDTFICATLVGQKRVLPAAEGEADQVGGRGSSCSSGWRCSLCCRWCHKATRLPTFAAFPAVMMHACSAAVSKMPACPPKPAAASCGSDPQRHRACGAKSGGRRHRPCGQDQPPPRSRFVGAWVC